MCSTFFCSRHHLAEYLLVTNVIMFELIRLKVTAAEEQLAKIGLTNDCKHQQRDLKYIHKY